MPSSVAEKEPILDYTNWADWSEYWHDHLAALDLWQFTDPNAAAVLPQPNSVANREIIKKANANMFQKSAENCLVDIPLYEVSGLPFELAAIVALSCHL